MDSISRAPIPPSALNLRTDPDSRLESSIEGVAENQPPVSKKGSSNSKRQPCMLNHFPLNKTMSLAINASWSVLIHFA